MTILIRTPSSLRVIPRPALILLASLILTACSSIPPNQGQVPSAAFTDTDNTSMGGFGSQAVADNNGKTGILLLNTGLDAFVARALLAARAERSLDVQYYLFHRDLSGRLLLQCGVKIYEANSQALLRDVDLSQKISATSRKRKKLGMSRSSLHAKMFMFDRRYTFIGSMNLDPRSVTQNTEIGAVIDSPAVATQFAESMSSKAPDIAFVLTLDEDGNIRWDGYDDGEPVSYFKDPHTGALQRAKVQLMRLLPIESQI